MKSATKYLLEMFCSIKTGGLYRTVFVMLLSVLLPYRIFAFDNDRVADCAISTEDDDKGKSICYRFGGINLFTLIIEEGDSLCDISISDLIGGNNLFTLIIEEGDSLCDISISDLNGRCISIKCEKTPILKWAFDNLDTVINSPDFAVSESYFPELGELSLIIGKKKSIIKNYAKYKIIGNDELEGKIRELVSFMEKIWITEFFSKYGLDSFHVKKKKSIWLRFGYNNVFSVAVEEGGKNCNVHISDEYGRAITGECEKIPILEWAFDNMADIEKGRYSKKKFKVKRNMSPGMSELSMAIGGYHTIITNYANDKIVGNNELDDKIRELRSLLYNLWEREFYAKYGLELFLENKEK